MVDRAGLAAVPKPIGVGPEMAALRRFLPEVVTWEAPSTRAGGAGHARDARDWPGHSQVIQDGRWIAGDDEQDQPLADGTFVLTWQFHWVSGSPARRVPGDDGR